MEKIIGLMGAMPDEIAPLAARMEDRTEETVGGVTFTSGRLGGKKVVLCCAGMGKAQAAAAVQLLATYFHVSAVVFSGIAGNMSGRVGLGDIIVGDVVVYHDGEPRMFAETYPHLQTFRCDARMIAAALDACDACGVKAEPGTIATATASWATAPRNRPSRTSARPTAWRWRAPPWRTSPRRTICRASSCAR